MSDGAARRVGSVPLGAAASDNAISLEDTVGRTVARVETGEIKGPYGYEPTVTLHFTDGTYYLAALYEREEMLEEDWALKRVGSAHVEDVVGGRARCRICGWIDEADAENPTVREWHGDSFGDVDVPDGAEDFAGRSRLVKPPGTR